MVYVFFADSPASKDRDIRTGRLFQTVLRGHGNPVRNTGLP